MKRALAELSNNAQQAAKQRKGFRPSRREPEPERNGSDLQEEENGWTTVGLRSTARPEMYLPSDGANLAVNLDDQEEISLDEDDKDCVGDGTGAHLSSCGLTEAEANGEASLQTRVDLVQSNVDSSRNGLNSAEESFTTPDPDCKETGSTSRLTADEDGLVEEAGADSQSWVSGDGLGRDGFSRGVVERDGVSRDGVSGGGVSKDGVRRDGFSRGGVIGDAVTKESLSRERISRESVSRVGVSRDGVSRDEVRLIERVEKPVSAAMDAGFRIGASRIRMSEDRSARGDPVLPAESSSAGGRNFAAERSDTAESEPAFGVQTKDFTRKAETSQSLEMRGSREERLGLGVRDEPVAERAAVAWGFQPGFGVRTRAESRRASRRLTRGIRTAPAPAVSAALLLTDMRRASESQAVRSTPRVSTIEGSTLQASLLDARDSTLLEANGKAAQPLESDALASRLVDGLLPKPGEEQQDPSCPNVNTVGHLLTERSLRSETQCQKLSQLVQLSYLAKCRELDIVPLSRLRSQVRNPLCNLAHCQLGPKHGEALAFSLQLNDVVTALNLVDNELGCETVKQLVDSVVGTKRITELDLSRNDLGWEGAAALTRLLENSPPLNLPDAVENVRRLSFMKSFDSRKSTQDGEDAEQSDATDSKADVWSAEVDFRGALEEGERPRMLETEKDSGKSPSGMVPERNVSGLELQAEAYKVQRPPSIPAVLNLASGSGIPAVVPLLSSPPSREARASLRKSLNSRSSVTFEESEAVVLGARSPNSDMSKPEPGLDGANLGAQRGKQLATLETGTVISANDELVKSMENVQRKGDTLGKGEGHQTVPAWAIDGQELEEENFPPEPHEWVDASTLRRLTEVELTEDDTWQDSPRAPESEASLGPVTPKKKVKMTIRTVPLCGSFFFLCGSEENELVF
jgi:hypothetical protein